MCCHTALSCRNRTDEGVREEHRLEKALGSLSFRDVVKSCPSINAILRSLVDGFARKAETSDRPAGPPPMQTTSYISGFVAVDVAVVKRDRRIAGGSASSLVTALREVADAIGEAIAVYRDMSCVEMFGRK